MSAMGKFVKAVPGHMRLCSLIAGSGFCVVVVTVTVWVVWVEYSGVDRSVAGSGLSRYLLKVAVSVPLISAVIAWQVKAAWIGGVVALGCLATAITIFLTIRRFQDG